MGRGMVFQAGCEYLVTFLREFAELRRFWWSSHILQEHGIIHYSGPWTTRKHHLDCSNFHFYGCPSKDELEL